MKIRSILLILLAFALSCGVARSVWAQPNSFNSVSVERVHELETMHQRAIDSLLKNDFQAAIDAYSDILLLEPDDETAYTGLGQIYLVQGKYKHAHEAFENALHINPENEVALAGIRRIMDPDGVEGMVTRAELEGRPAQQPVLSTPPAKPIPAPGNQNARMDRRQSAMKAKKPVVRTVRPVRIGRLGLLNAQRMQMALKVAGHYDGPVNGLIGDSTKHAIRRFQTQFGIVPSGRMTPVTWTKLSEYLSTP